MESGVAFVSLDEQRGDQPRIDFYFESDEDIPVTSIVGEILIADPFTIGNNLKFPRNTLSLNHFEL